MSKPNPIVSSITNATFGLWFPFFRFMCRTLPPVWVARLAEATAERAIWERESVRDAILDNFAHVLKVPRKDRAVEEAGRTMVSRHSRFWIDLLRFAGRPPKETAGLLSERIGDEELLKAHERGRGAILLTAHVGNFELGGIFLRQIGLKDNYAVYAPDPSPIIEEHRENARRSLGVTGIPVTSSPFSFLPIVRALERNGIVAMQGDRDVSGTGREFPFFGEMTSFPIGPFRIASLSGAPLFPAFVLQDDDGVRYRSVIEPPIFVAPGKDAEERDEEIRVAMQNFVAGLERMIRVHPTQWYGFRRFWERTSGTD
jgi:lauroyl/myristoyl acyltransferase